MVTVPQRAVGQVLYGNFNTANRLVDNVVANVVNVGPNAATEFDSVDLGEVLGPGEIAVP